MLTSDSLSVSPDFVTEYCARRGFCAPDEPALWRGQDYIAGVYNSRFGVEFDNASAPDAVKFAVIEAARREAQKAGSLLPDVVLADKKQLIELDVLKWDTGGKKQTAKDYIPKISVIENLLKPFLLAGASRVKLERA